ncbi:hypothetical protein D3C78_1373400 [compost metagenome]
MVRGETSSSLAISLLDRPSATSRRITISRSVTFSSCCLTSAVSASCCCSWMLLRIALRRLSSSRLRSIGLVMKSTAPPRKARVHCSRSPWPVMKMIGSLFSLMLRMSCSARPLMSGMRISSTRQPISPGA